MRRITVGAGIAAVLTLGIEHREQLRNSASDGWAKLSEVRGSDNPVPKWSANPFQAGSDPRIVHLSNQSGLDVPSQRVARWTITDSRFGRVAVYVPVGKTPREAFTVALAERGYQVVR